MIILLCLTIVSEAVFAIVLHGFYSDEFNYVNPKGYPTCLVFSSQHLPNGVFCLFALTIVVKMMHIYKYQKGIEMKEELLTSGSN